VVKENETAATARALNSGAVHLLRAIAAFDRASGVPAARLSALSVLVFGGPRSLGRLAATEGVTSPTMTRVVDGLVEAGLARRTPYPGDARQVLVAATPEGEELMRDAAQRRIDALVAALAGLAPEQRAALATAAPLLEDLAGRLRHSTRPPQETSSRAGRNQRP
jgi:DNA-binding MarR family transcriptional regulator